MPGWYANMNICLHSHDINCQCRNCKPLERPCNCKWCNVLESTIRTRCESGEFDTAYADYIITHATGEYSVVKDSLTSLLFHMKRRYLFDDFVSYMRIKLFTSIHNAV
jgi:hypothetical protein